MNKDNTVLELLDITQELIENLEHYGLAPKRETVEKVISITKEFTKEKDKELKKKDEQATIKNKNKS
jgi:hypothetical protein